MQSNTQSLVGLKAGEAALSSTHATLVQLVTKIAQFTDFPGMEANIADLDPA